ncbi:MAG TPA: FtsX-like permease family protein [bacterium]|nr:FtsX-like permease family protein [bacterium]
MMLKLALRNLWGAGLRTVLNVAVLSFAFVAIIWLQGLYEGMNQQASQALLREAYGGGQYWHPLYDPYDPLSIIDSQGLLPVKIDSFVHRKQATAILLIQGTLYPQGRVQTVVISGIDPDQRVLDMPVDVLKTDDSDIPALLGTRMAKTCGLSTGDAVILRWRDRNGTFDARQIRIVEIMHTNVQMIDNGRVWIPLHKLQEMTLRPNEATLVVLDRSTTRTASADWTFHNTDELLQDIHELVKVKQIGGMVLYVILLFLAMLAIFDTQVLSIFRRRKEIGTLMALGMTRWQVVRLFTLEGALHGIFAALLAAIYGIPLLVIYARHGMQLTDAVDSMGISLGTQLYPVYSTGMILATVVIVLTTVTVVSYLPSRRIAKLKPTDALRGKRA